MSSGRLTIVDIAKMAGVSRSTVSRAINNDSGISEETKARIMEIIQSVNFRPNVNARRTVQRRCDSLGLYIGKRVLIRDANVQVLSGIIEKCNEAKYDLLLISSCSPERIMEVYGEGKVDGFIILNPYPENRDMLQRLKDEGIPYSCTAVCSENDSFDFVDTDNRKAAYEAVEYLIKMGHRKIAVLSDENSISSIELREAGYRDCMKDHGIPVPDEYVLSLKTPGNAADIDKFRQLMNSDNRPTAIFACSDERAMIALNWLKSNSYKVPEDVSVIGFDDLQEVISGYPLTTVRQNFYGRGYYACKNVLQQIEKGPENLERQIFLSHQLIIRDTVKNINT